MPSPYSLSCTSRYYTYPRSAIWLQEQLVRSTTTIRFQSFVMFFGDHPRYSHLSYILLDPCVTLGRNLLGVVGEKDSGRQRGQAIEQTRTAGSEDDRTFNCWMSRSATGDETNDERRRGFEACPVEQIRLFMRAFTGRRVTGARMSRTMGSGSFGVWVHREIYNARLAAENWQ